MTETGICFVITPTDSIFSVGLVTCRVCPIPIGWYLNRAVESTDVDCQAGKREKRMFDQSSLLLSLSPPPPYPSPLCLILSSLLLTLPLSLHDHLPHFSPRSLLPFMTTYHMFLVGPVCSHWLPYKPPLLFWCKPCSRRKDIHHIHPAESPCLQLTKPYIVQDRTMQLILPHKSCTLPLMLIHVMV